MEVNCSKMCKNMNGQFTKNFSKWQISIWKCFHPHWILRKMQIKKHKTISLHDKKKAADTNIKIIANINIQFSSLQSFSFVWLFATPWVAACQASLSITIFRSSLKLTSVESVIPSSHLILGHPLLLLPPIPSSIRVFSNESTLPKRWPKYWSFSFS